MTGRIDGRIIRLRPYDSGGFSGIHTIDGGVTWYAMGLSDGNTRRWWRQYARINGYKLVEWRERCY